VSDTQTYQDVLLVLNEHVRTCRQCKSANDGICERAEQFLDDLLWASTPRVTREDDDATS
jgi:hypothetical protein